MLKILMAHTWKASIRTYTLKSTVHDYRPEYSLKEIMDLRLDLPILCTALSRGRGATARNNKSNIVEMDKIRANCKDWLLANCYTKATDCYHLAELKALHMKIGKWVAAARFINLNPGWLMKLPKVPGHDDKSAFYWRAQFDERCNVPLDELMSLMPGKVRKSHIDMLMGKMATAYSFYRCASQIQLLCPEGWRTYECGLILPAI